MKGFATWGRLPLWVCFQGHIHPSAGIVYERINIWHIQFSLMMTTKSRADQHFHLAMVRRSDIFPTKSFQIGPGMGVAYLGWRVYTMIGEYLLQKRWSRSRTQKQAHASKRVHVEAVMRTPESVARHLVALTPWDARQCTVATLVWLMGHTVGNRVEPSCTTNSEARSEGAVTGKPITV